MKTSNVQETEPLISSGNGANAMNTKSSLSKSRRGLLYSIFVILSFLIVFYFLDGFSYFSSGSRNIDRISSKLGAGVKVNAGCCAYDVKTGLEECKKCCVDLKNDESFTDEWQTNCESACDNEDIRREKGVFREDDGLAKACQMQRGSCSSVDQSCYADDQGENGRLTLCNADGLDAGVSNVCFCDETVEGTATCIANVDCSDNENRPICTDSNDCNADSECVINCCRGSIDNDEYYLKLFFGYSDDENQIKGRCMPKCGNALTLEQANYERKKRERNEELGISSANCIAEGSACTPGPGNNCCGIGYCKAGVCAPCNQEGDGCRKNDVCCSTNCNGGVCGSPTPAPTAPTPPPTPPPTNPPPPPPAPTPCFAESNEILTLNKGEIKLSELEIGDYVLSRDSFTSNIKWSQIWAVRRHFGNNHRMKNIQFDNNEMITLTDDHLIYSRNPELGESELILKKAVEVQMDEILFYYNSALSKFDEVRVTNIFYTNGNKAIIPITEDFDVVVSNVLSSPYCHSAIDAKRAYLASYPFILISKYISSKFASNFAILAYDVVYKPAREILQISYIFDYQITPFVIMAIFTILVVKTIKNYTAKQ